MRRAYAAATVAVPLGPATGVLAQVVLIASLAGAVALGGAGLTPAAWIVGIACGVVANAALALGLAHYGSDRLSPADRVTLVRGTLAVGVAALVADSFGRPAPVTALVPLAVIALALDAVDGWVARRTRTAGALGAHFDAEVDAFLILVLSVYVARAAGAWVLAIGVARYAFLAAGCALPWMRPPLPPRRWRKVVAATQGIVLTVAAADVLPPHLTRAALVVALGLLAESFGRDVWWLWRRREPATAPPSDPGRGRLRTGLAAALTILALLLVWAALVAPDEPSRLTLGAFVRLPLEGLLVIAVAVVLPAKARRLFAAVGGPLLALVVVLKILDFGFFASFDRPFDIYNDSGYAGTGIETLRESIGSTQAHLVLAGVVVGVVALFALTTLAVFRLTRVAAGHRRWSLVAVGALGVVWVLCRAFGAQLVSDTPVASTSAAGVVAGEVRMVRAGIEDHAVFAREIDHDPFRATPADRLLTGLRGHDVVVAFVESYGRSAVQGSDFSPQVDTALDAGTQRLQAAGYSARSAFLTSSTFGGISWLAHSTLQSGLQVDTQRRYDQLVASRRLTLSDAFGRAGWRTVGDVPTNDRAWPQGSSFYHYDKLYDRRNVGYAGPTFAYASMPDEYSLAALQRRELARRHRRRVFAEIDLVSSHTPWTRIPRMVPWRDLGDGSVFNRIPVSQTSKADLWSDPERLRAAYGRSITYSMNSLVSFARHSHDRHLVLVVLGDHQPWSFISGQEPSHDVPISVIARDPAVLHRIAGWRWADGLRPGSHAPVWPMSAFRDRFLGAFDSGAAAR
jgi:phosphatidylglycerophosphate synthase